MTHARSANPVLLVLIVLLAVLGATVDAAWAADKTDKKAAKAEKKRAEIDSMAEEALEHVLGESATAKSLFASAAGYAVFDNWKTSLLLAGGSGSGVAVDKAAKTRTYMKMKTVGVKLGFGVQKCQVVFLFQDSERLARFVNEGWEAEAGSDAAAWTEGANLEAKWTNGMAVFQITEAGLMLSVDLSGTKYYKAKNLN
jgi:lipid-binding SYLF domain-containing protein